ncbi:MAG TPA: gluconate 2-dehydrogenase subunit 3 family protein [Gemmatimonadales bacterium]|nr:gluconate 2-dehydrogenase subunit 3 family protein [Gemmatimonadales bacterium]
MSLGEMTRRELLALIGTAAVVGACGREGAGRRGGGAAGSAGATADAGRAPQFFTPHEYATVTLLGDLIIPRDERSGSASDAGAPAYLDYALREIESDAARTEIRGGLAWLDAECGRRYGKTFLQAAPAERTAVLDDIAWPKQARKELHPGVVFFSDFRDLVATAFWSSRMGVKDLRYEGNVARPAWDGCPPAALAKLGVSYEAVADGRNGGHTETRS